MWLEKYLLPYVIAFLYIDNFAPNATPSRSGLNLFDEILIEEGTAKKASYDEVCINMEKKLLVFCRGEFVPNFLM